MELIGSVPEPEHSEDVRLKIGNRNFQNVDEESCRSNSIQEGASNLHQKIIIDDEEPTSPINHFGTNNSDIDNKRKSDHFETYMKIHNLNSFYGAIVGLKITKTWKYNNATRWTKFMLFIGTATAIYSHLLVISQPTKLIEVFSLFAVIAPAILKFDLYIKSNDKAYKVNEFLEELFKNNVDGPKANVLKTHIDRTFTSIKIFVSLQTLSLLVFLCYPIYAYVANNEIIQIMPMQFPLLNQSSTNGVIVANLIMLKMGVWAYVGSVGFDIFLSRFIFSYAALVKLLQQDLIEYVEMCKKTSEYSKSYRKAFFHNFLLKCQDKDRFLQFINETYADVIFKQFGVVYVCLIFAIYAIIRSSWYSGYGFLAFCLCEIYILCILGTTIKNENDKFCAAIYEIPWYDYSVVEQKEILLLLHSSQNAMELWVGPFAPLNVETALQITKSIYSTSTMIINTQD